MSDWIAWAGGECPVAPETMVQLRYRDGRIGFELPPVLAGGHDWEHWPEFARSDIVAYRVMPS